MMKQQLPLGKKLNAVQMKSCKGGWWYDPNWTFEQMVNNCQPSGNACTTYLDCNMPHGCISSVPLYLDCIGGGCVVLEGLRP
jgi:hypothetical protein